MNIGSRYSYHLFLNCIAVLVMVLPEIDQRYFPKQKDADSLEWMILEEKH